MDETMTYVFDVERETTGRLWDGLSWHVDPNDLFYAVWANFYHNEPYFLDDIFENQHFEDLEDATGFNEMLMIWVDEFYLNWCDQIDELARSKQLNLYRCDVDLITHTLYLVFRRRNNHEAFYPHFVHS